MLATPLEWGLLSPVDLPHLCSTHALLKCSKVFSSRKEFFHFLRVACSWKTERQMLNALYIAVWLVFCFFFCTNHIWSKKKYSLSFKFSVILSEKAVKNIRLQSSNRPVIGWLLKITNCRTAGTFFFPIDELFYLLFLFASGFLHLRVIAIQRERSSKQR